jgi:hypothetical protein
MTKIMTVNSPSIADILFNTENITHNQIGIDTIRLTPIYETVMKLVNRLGLKATKPTKNSPVSETIAKILKASQRDFKKRYKADKFSPVVEIVKLTKGKSVSNYMIVIRNTPLLFDLATHHKKAKDTFCMVVFTGLHQPTKKIESEAMKIISTFTKRKTFKLHSLDIAIDTQDKRSISHKRKESFKADLMPYSKHGVISKGSSLYINYLEQKQGISRILYYDKYLKQTQHHKQEGISTELQDWKRLEVTLSFDVTERHNKGFTQYIEGLNFVDDLYDIDEVARLAQVKNYDTDYLIYQINSLLDKRFMNNHESKKQFNSVESLARFKMSDFRRFTLAL